MLIVVYTTATWSQVTGITGALPAARNSHTSVIIPSSNAIYVLGGWNGATYNDDNDVWVFSTGSGERGHLVWGNMRGVCAGDSIGCGSLLLH